MENPRLRGGNFHDKLGEYAVKKLKELGIRKIVMEVKLPSGPRVDILAFDNDKKIVVECQVVVQPKWVKKRKEAILRDVDKLIYCAPASECNKLRGIEGIEVWEAPIEPSKRKTITVKFEIWQELLRIKAELGKRSLDDVLKELIETWRKLKPKEE